MMPWTAYIAIALLLVALHGAGVDGLRLSDLPRNPGASCAPATILNALLTCKGAGVSQPCCSGLDKLLWDSGSPTAGCLCYPHVLYQVIQASRAHRLDALALLDDCSQQHSMKTEWALKTDTACPQISISASSESLILQLSQEPVLLLKGTPAASWAWSNLLQTGRLMGMPALRHTLASGPTLGTHTLITVFTMFCCIVPLYVILHKFVLCALPAYRRLDAAHRLVSCQHAAFLLVFTLQLLPQSILSIRCLFKTWTAEYVMSAEMQVLVGFIVAMRAVLYIVEACIRSVVRFSWLLLVHHQLYFFVLLSAIWTLNAPAFMIGLVLDWMACLEVPLYLALLAYRLEMPSQHARLILVLACGWYILTRVFQTVMLLYMIIGWASDPLVNRTPAYILTSVMCGAFTVIQAYTLVIYHGIWCKLRKEKDGELSRGSSTEDLVCDVSDAVYAKDESPISKPLIHRLHASCHAST